MATTIARQVAGDTSTVFTGGGTHSIEGLPMSARTRTALRGLGLENPDHRSHQFDEQDASSADLVVAFEPGNVAWIRRVHPGVSERSATIGHLVTHLGFGEDQPVAERVQALGLASVEPTTQRELIDPAGGDQDTFNRCVAEVDEYVRALLPLL